MAVASFAVMAFGAFWAVRFLMTGERRYDGRSKTAMEVTLVFVVATMISGDLWTRFEWGVWWVWEPRLTTYFILMLLVIGYFILRNALDDPERRARFSAVFCIVAFVDAPISFLITRLVPSSIHPVVFRTDSGLPPMMLIPFLLGLFGMLLVAFALTRIALRINGAALEVEMLKEKLEEQDAWRERAAADEALERLRAAGAKVAAGAQAAGLESAPLGTLVQMSPLPALRTPSAPTRSRPLHLMRGDCRVQPRHAQHTQGGLTMDPILAEVYSTVLPAAPFVVAAYVGIWVVLAVYVFVLSRRAKRTERDLDALKRALDARDREHE